MEVIRVTTVENAKDTKVVFGKIVPKQKVQLSFERGGKVEKINKFPGDHVKKGELIASLEQVEAVSRQQQFLSALKRAEESLATATAEKAPEIQQRIAQIEAQLQGIEAAIKQGQIVAPFTGVVSAIEITIGQSIPPSSAVATIVEEAPPLIEVRISESISSLIADEQDVWASIGNRSKLVNVVSRESIRGPTKDELVKFQFKEEIESEAWSYGEVVELSFFSETALSGSWLPLSVLQQTVAEQWSVYVAKPVSAEATTFNVERRAVNVLLVQNGEALIDNSLNADELVIRDGTHRIVVGQKVQPQILPGVAQ